MLNPQLQTLMQTLNEQEDARKAEAERRRREAQAAQGGRAGLEARVRQLEGQLEIMQRQEAAVQAAALQRQDELAADLLQSRSLIAEHCGSADARARAVERASALRLHRSPPPAVIPNPAVAEAPAPADAPPAVEVPPLDARLRGAPARQGEVSTSTVTHHAFAGPGPGWVLAELPAERPNDPPSIKGPFNQ